MLDTGPLGLVSHPNAATRNLRASRWLRDLLLDEVTICVPEIADYELRRELLRAEKSRSVAVLDRYKATLCYVPLTTDAMLLAASFWATARRQGRPTAPDLALDGDVILAAQATELAGSDDEVVVATTNPGHLSRFVTARNWWEIEARPRS